MRVRLPAAPDPAQLSFTPRPVTAGFDAGGDWHDPGNGKFAKPGWSTAKALVMRAVRGLDLADALRDDRDGAFLRLRADAPRAAADALGGRHNVFHGLWRDAEHAVVRVNDRPVLVPWRHLEAAPPEFNDLVTAPDRGLADYVTPGVLRWTRKLASGDWRASFADDYEDNPSQRNAEMLWDLLVGMDGSRQWIDEALTSSAPDRDAIETLQQAHLAAVDELGSEGHTFERTNTSESDPFAGGMHINRMGARPASGLTSWYRTDGPYANAYRSSWGQFPHSAEFDSSRVLANIGMLHDNGEYLIAEDPATIARLMNGDFPAVRTGGDFNDLPRSSAPADEAQAAIGEPFHPPTVVRALYHRGDNPAEFTPDGSRWGHGGAYFTTDAPLDAWKSADAWTVHGNFKLYEIRDNVNGSAVIHRGYSTDPQYNKLWDWAMARNGYEKVDASAQLRPEWVAQNPDKVMRWPDLSWDERQRVDATMKEALSAAGFDGWWMGGEVVLWNFDAIDKPADDFNDLPEVFSTDDAVGDCYSTAVRVAAALEDDGKRNVRVVHGTVLYQGDDPRVPEGSHITHAWVEYDEVVTVPDNAPPELRRAWHDTAIPIVVDRSNGNNVEVPRQVYYGIGQVENPAKYTVEQAHIQMLSSGHYGPWDGTDGDFNDLPGEHRPTVGEVAGRMRDKRSTLAEEAAVGEALADMFTLDDLPLGVRAQAQFDSPAEPTREDPDGPLLHGWMVNGQFVSPDGDEIGEFNRILYADRNTGTVTVEHHTISLDEEWRGHGIAPQFIERTFAAYQAAGFDRIITDGASTVGGSYTDGAYVWARQGWKWDLSTPRNRRTFLRSAVPVATALEALARRDDLDEDPAPIADAAARLRALIAKVERGGEAEVGDIQPADIANLGRSRSIGKTVLNPATNPFAPPSGRNGQASLDFRYQRPIPPPEFNDLTAGPGRFGWVPQPAFPVEDVREAKVKSDFGVEVASRTGRIADPGHPVIGYRGMSDAAEIRSAAAAGSGGWQSHGAATSGGERGTSFSATPENLFGDLAVPTWGGEYRDKRYVTQVAVDLRGLPFSTIAKIADGKVAAERRLGVAITGDVPFDRILAVRTLRPDAARQLDRIAERRDAAIESLQDQAAREKGWDSYRAYLNTPSWRVPEDRRLTIGVDEDYKARKRRVADQAESASNAVLHDETNWDEHVGPAAVREWLALSEWNDMPDQPGFRVRDVPRSMRGSGPAHHKWLKGLMVGDPVIHVHGDWSATGTVATIDEATPRYVKIGGARFDRDSGDQHGSFGFIVEPTPDVIAKLGQLGADQGVEFNDMADPNDSWHEYLPEGRLREALLHYQQGMNWGRPVYAELGAAVKAVVEGRPVPATDPDRMMGYVGGQEKLEADARAIVEGLATQARPIDATVWRGTVVKTVDNRPDDLDPTGWSFDEATGKWVHSTGYVRPDRFEDSFSIIEPKVGDTFTAGLMSFSSSRDVARAAAAHGPVGIGGEQPVGSLPPEWQVVYRLDKPVGVAMPNYAGEREVVAAGTFTVTSVERDPDGRWFVDLAQTPPGPPSAVALQALADEPVVARIVDRYQAAGHPVYVVGGAVRDALAGKAPNDIDLTSPATPEQTSELLDPIGAVYPLGIEHGTVVVNTDGQDYEVTTHRTERYDPDSRSPITEFTDDLQADLARRDFTVNAMAFNPATGEVIDPFGGRADLEAGIIRAVGNPDERFSEDPLRIIRAVRFAAVNGWAIDPATAEAARRQADRLDIVSAERVNAELDKVLKSPHPDALGAAAEEARKLGVSDRMFGPLDAGFKWPVTDGMVAPWSVELPPQYRLAALVQHAEVDPGVLVSKMKRGRDEARRVADVLNAAKMIRGGQAAGALRRYPDETIVAVEAITTYASPMLAGWWANREALRAPLPVNGDDMIALGLTGREVGDALARVERLFLERGGRLTRDEAIAAANRERVLA